MRLTSSNISIIRRLLVGRGSRPLRSILEKLDITDLLRLMPLLSAPEVRVLLDSLHSLGSAAELLARLSESHLEEILPAIDDPLILAIVEKSSDDEAAHFLSHMPEERKEALLEKMPTDRRAKVLLFLSYPEDSVGRLMQQDIFYLPISMTVAEALQALRQRAAESSIYYLSLIHI